MFLLLSASSQPGYREQRFLKGHGRGLGATGDYVFLFPVFFPGRTALLCLWMFTLAMWLLVAYQFYGFLVEALHHFHHIPFPRRQWLCSVYQTGGSDMNVWITVVGRTLWWAGLTWAMSKNNAFVVISHWDFIQPQYNLNILTNTGKVYLDLPFRFIFHPRGWL